MTDSQLEQIKDAVVEKMKHPQPNLFIPTKGTVDKKKEREHQEIEQRVALNPDLYMNHPTGQLDKDGKPVIIRKVKTWQRKQMTGPRTEAELQAGPPYGE